MKNYISIITPCYNGERFIEQYMCAVLNQTYRKFELILVNDGSTDNSERIILSYKQQLEEFGIQFKYINKINGGQPSAINAGLQHIEGEFITWPDIDDVMHPDYLEKKINYFLEHPNVDYLITRSAVKYLSNPDEIIRYTWDSEPKSNDDVLFRILHDYKYNYEPGNFMVRTSIFRKAHPTMKIYDKCGKWAGPQIQMMFPIICIGNFGYSKECLFDYYIHENNDHNRIKDDKQLLIKTTEAVKLWDNVFDEYYRIFSDKNIFQYREIVFERLNRMLLNYAFKCRDIQKYNHSFEQLKHKNYKEHIKKIIIQNDLLFEAYCLVKNRR